MLFISERQKAMRSFLLMYSPTRMTRFPRTKVLKHPYCTTIVRQGCLLENEPVRAELTECNTQRQDKSHGI